MEAHTGALVNRRGGWTENTGSTSRLRAILLVSPTKPARLRLSGRHRGHQLGEPNDVEDPPEIIDECGQAEFGADLLQATRQKRTLVHPLLDRAERVFDRLTAAVKDIGALRQSGLHPVQYRFVLKTRYRAKPAFVRRERITQPSHASLLV